MPEFQFDGFSAFLDMGGYALYVWPVYILFAMFFVITVVPPLLGRKKRLKQLKARMARADFDRHHDKNSEGESH
ncbi:MAG: heme exporter protein CcmD [Pseudohongiellaceae bacterium]|jgi:heme exporter protein D